MSIRTDNGSGCISSFCSNEPEQNNFLAEASQYRHKAKAAFKWLRLITFDLSTRAESKSQSHDLRSGSIGVRNGITRTLQLAIDIVPEPFGFGVPFHLPGHSWQMPMLPLIVQQRESEH